MLTNNVTLAQLGKITLQVVRGLFCSGKFLAKEIWGIQFYSVALYPNFKNQKTIFETFWKLIEWQVSVFQPTREKSKRYQRWVTMKLSSKFRNRQILWRNIICSIILLFISIIWLLSFVSGISLKRTVNAIWRQFKWWEWLSKTYHPKDFTIFNKAKNGTRRAQIPWKPLIVFKWTKMRNKWPAKLSREQKGGILNTTNISIATVLYSQRVFADISS